ncbi:MAG: hypothetical protein Q7T16_01205 [Candidatus Burarchaeum sp.]|nr:hypothetical protein [Candidatus Burarchaeum sp.]MDO8339254.1 hypothetical protein [Candidatus Burarchaeum sp.]
MIGLTRKSESEIEALLKKNLLNHDYGWSGDPYKAYTYDALMHEVFETGAKTPDKQDQENFRNALNKLIEQGVIEKKSTDMEIYTLSNSDILKKQKPTFRESSKMAALVLIIIIAFAQFFGLITGTIAVDAMIAVVVYILIALFLNAISHDVTARFAEIKPQAIIGVRKHLLPLLLTIIAFVCAYLWIGIANISAVVAISGLVWVISDNILGEKSRNV